MKKLLALGDSMVFGYLAPRSDCWTARIHDTGRFKVINRGINGDLTEGMLRRFPSQVLDECPDLLLLLGGTNDFLAGIPLRDTCNNMMYMMRRAQGEGIRVHLLTLPPYCLQGFSEDLRFYGDFARAEKMRVSYNEWVRNQAECLDLASPFESMTEEELVRLYIDGVHFNSEGHSAAADVIFEHI